MKVYQIFVLLSLAGFLMLATAAAKEDDGVGVSSSPAGSTRRPRKRKHGRGNRRPSTSPPVVRNNSNNCTVERDLDLAQCVLPGQIVGYTDFVYPKNDQEMEAICRQGMISVGCGANYTKDCLRGVPAQMTSILLSGTKRSFRTRCKTQRERKEFITALQCFENREASTQVHQCMTIAVHKLSYLANDRQLNQDSIIPAMCCAFQQFVGCARDSLRAACSASPSVPKDRVHDVAEFLLDMTQESTGEAIDLFCGKFTNLETCTELLPVAMNNFNSLEENVRDGTAQELPYGTAFVGPMIKIFSRSDF